MSWFLSIAVAGFVAGGPAASLSHDSLRPTTPAVPTQTLLTNEHRQVRSMNPRITKLLAEGARRSRTFADLIQRLHGTDVIVYVEPTFTLPIETSGRILLSAFTGNRRYLRVQVRSTLQGDQMIAVIAHELQHALEVAMDPGVVDAAGVTALYTRIGESAHGGIGFDTRAARDTGRVVRNELMGIAASGRS